MTWQEAFGFIEKYQTLIAGVLAIVAGYVAYRGAIAQAKAAVTSTDRAADFERRAAAGASPDPAFPSDGANLLPVLTAGAALVPRTLFWRYKANAQRAMRDGDYLLVYASSARGGFLVSLVNASDVGPGATSCTLR